MAQVTIIFNFIKIVVILTYSSVYIYVDNNANLFVALPSVVTIFLSIITCKLLNFGAARHRHEELYIIGQELRQAQKHADDLFPQFVIFLWIESETRNHIRTLTILFSAT